MANITFGAILDFTKVKTKAIADSMVKVGKNVNKIMTSQLTSAFTTAGRRAGNMFGKMFVKQANNVWAGIPPRLQRQVAQPSVLKKTAQAWGKAISSGLGKGASAGFKKVNSIADSSVKIIGRLFAFRIANALVDAISGIAFNLQSLKTLEEEFQRIDRLAATAGQSVLAFGLQNVRLAGQFATTTEEVVNAKEAVALLGGEYRNTAKGASLLEAALSAQKVAGLGAADAVQVLIAIEKQFTDTFAAQADIVKELNLDFTNYKGILGLMAGAAAETSATLQDMLQAMTKAGGVLAEEFGGDLTSVLSLIATMVQTTKKSGSQVGTALQTLVTRIRKMPETVKILEDVFAIEPGTDFLHTISAIANKLESMVNGTAQSAKEANELSAQLSGVRRASDFIALLRNTIDAMSGDFVRVRDAVRGMGDGVDIANKKLDTLTNTHLKAIARFEGFQKLSDAVKGQFAVSVVEATNRLEILRLKAASILPSIGILIFEGRDAFLKYTRSVESATIIMDEFVRTSDPAFLRMQDGIREAATQAAHLEKRLIGVKNELDELRKAQSEGADNREAIRNLEGQENVIRELLNKRRELRKEITTGEKLLAGQNIRQADLSGFLNIRQRQFLGGQDIENVDTRFLPPLKDEPNIKNRVERLKKEFERVNNSIQEINKNTKKVANEGIEGAIKKAEELTTKFQGLSSTTLGGVGVDSGDSKGSAAITKLGASEKQANAFARLGSELKEFAEFSIETQSALEAINHVESERVDRLDDEREAVKKLLQAELSIIDVVEQAARDKFAIEGGTLKLLDKLDEQRAKARLKNAKEISALFEREAERRKQIAETAANKIENIEQQLQEKRARQAELIASAINNMQADVDKAKSALQEARQSELSASEELSKAYSEERSARLQLAAVITDFNIKLKMAEIDAAKATNEISGFNEEIKALKRAEKDLLSVPRTFNDIIKIRQEMARRELQIVEGALSEIRSAGESFFTATREQAFELQRGLAGIQNILPQLFGGGDINTIGNSLLTLPSSIRQSISDALSQLPSFFTIGGRSVGEIRQRIGEVTTGAQEQGPDPQELAERQAELIEQIAKMDAEAVGTARLQLQESKKQTDRAAVALEEAKIQTKLAEEFLSMTGEFRTEDAQAIERNLRQQEQMTSELSEQKNIERQQLTRLEELREEVAKLAPVVQKSMEIIRSRLGEIFAGQLGELGLGQASITRLQSDAVNALSVAVPRSVAGATRVNTSEITGETDNAKQAIDQLRVNVQDANAKQEALLQQQIDAAQRQFNDQKAVLEEGFSKLVDTFSTRQEQATSTEATPRDVNINLDQEANITVGVRGETLGQQIVSALESSEFIQFLRSVGVRVDQIEDTIADLVDSAATRGLVDALGRGQ